MKIIDWLRPGIKVKRWISLAFMGILLISFGILEINTYRTYAIKYIAFYIFLIISGIFVLYISVTMGIKSIIALINQGYINVSIDSKRLENMIYEKRLLVKGPKIVAIGGGTGLSTMLRGLKYYTSNITAIVTVADDGGGSGALREDLGILPPGDIRNCILSLADTEPLMEDLLQFRFKDGRLKGQSFGNLFLAAMDGISSNFEEAVHKMSSVLAVEGKVIPVTLENIVLKAKLRNGEIVEGESNIPKVAFNSNSPIEKMIIEPKNAKALNEAVNAIHEADAIILGPGSLYTSIIPNILVKDISSALNKTKAIKIYVSNILTQNGETDNFSVSDHIKAIIKHGGKHCIDYVVVNNNELKMEENKDVSNTNNFVKVDTKNINSLGVEVIEDNLVMISKNNHIRHNSDKLAFLLIKTIMEKKLYSDRKKIVEYFYLSQRIKEKKNNKEK